MFLVSNKSETPHSSMIFESAAKLGYYEAAVVRRNGDSLFRSLWVLCQVHKVCWEPTISRDEYGVISVNDQILSPMQSVLTTLKKKEGQSGKKVAWLYFNSYMHVYSIKLLLVAVEHSSKQKCSVVDLDTMLPQVKEIARYVCEKKGDKQER